MRYFKSFLAISWLLVVAFFYLKNHNTYFIDLVGYWKTKEVFSSGIFLRGWWLECAGMWVGAMIASLALLTRGFTRRSFWLTPLHILMFFLVMTWATGLQIYINMDVGVLDKAQKIVFYSPTDFAVADAGARLDLEPFQGQKYQQGTLITNYSRATWIPDMVSVKIKPALFFGRDLAITLVKIWGMFLVLALFFHNFGAVLLRKKEVLNEKFKSIGVGMAATMAILFFWGAIGQMTPWTAGGALLVFFLIGSVKIPKMIRWFFTLKWNVSVASLKTGTPWLVLVFFMFMGCNFLNSLAPFPSGYDSMHVYHNTPQLLTQYQTLISGITAYNYELLVSIPLFLLHNPGLGLQMVVFGGLLALGLLFVLFRKRFSFQISLLLTTLFAGMPMISFLMEEDLKIDMPLFFFSLLAIHEVFEWYQIENREKNTRKLLWIGLWLGLAFGIKYTSLLLIGTVFAFYAYTVWGGLGAMGIILVVLGVVGTNFDLVMLRSYSENIQQIVNLSLIFTGLVWTFFVGIKKKKIRSFLRPVAITAWMIGLVFLPWMVWNGLHAETLNMRGLLFGASQYPYLTLETQNICISASAYNEFKTYTGDYEGTSLALPLVILWESTVTSAFQNNVLTDIGFVFLGLALWLIFSFKELKRENPNIKTIILFTVLYGLLWLLTCNGMLWYGMPLFVGVLWLYGEAWSKSKWVYVVLGLWLLMNSYGRYTNLVINAQPLLYAGGLTNDELYMEQNGAGTYEITTFLNSEDAIHDKIYFIGSYTSYFIQYNDARIFRDKTLDTYACYFKDEDPNVILERFRSEGFKYILFTNQELKLEKAPTGPLHQQFEDFETFAVNYLEEVIYRDEMILYAIP